jgi:hypothetical protein
MKIVIIEWVDAHGGNRTGWKGLKEIESTVPANGRSVGFLVKETETHIVVCPHFVGDEPNIEGDGEMSIPKGWIKAIKVLRRG